MADDPLTDDDFVGIDPNPNSSKFEYFVLVSAVALAKLEGVPRLEIIRRMQIKNHDNERERGVPYPCQFISNVPKGKRTTLIRGIVKPTLKNISTVSLISPHDKKPKVEALVMIERGEWVGPAVKPIIADELKKIESSGRRKRIRSDIGCSYGEKSRPKKMVRKEDSGPDPPPDLPQNFRDKIKALNGSDLFRVMQKRLTATDVDKNKYRMSIPSRKIEHEFLTTEEKAVLENRKKGKKVQDIEVQLLEPSCDGVTTLSLRKWEMKKEKGKSSSIYNLVNENWFKNVVEINGLCEGTIVQLWSFRVEGKLQFALVKVDDAV